MSDFERNPMEIAAKYRVKKNEKSEFEIYSEQGSSLVLGRSSTFINFQATPDAVRRFAENHAESGETYVISLLVEELNIGFQGDEGWASALANDSFFVIDGETLKSSSLLNLRVVTEEHFSLEKSIFTDAVGDSSSPKTERADVSTGQASIMYNRADGFLECTIGLPQIHFQTLLDGCLSAQISRVFFKGIAGALSSSYTYGVARDLFLFADEQFYFTINPPTLDYRVKPDVPATTTEAIKEASLSTSDSEKILEALERVITSIGALRSSIVKTAWVLAVALVVATFIK